MGDLEDIMGLGDETPKKAKKAEPKKAEAKKSGTKKPRPKKAGASKASKKKPRAKKAGKPRKKKAKAASGKKRGNRASTSRKKPKPGARHGPKPGHSKPGPSRPEPTKPETKLQKTASSSPMPAPASTLTKKSRARMPSGVPGLDELIQGGFRRNSTVLVLGGPGCGKTTFLLQFLNDGALHGEPGLFISFEESREDILYDYASFDWNLKGQLDKGLLHFQEYQPHQVKDIMEQGGGMIRDLIKEEGIKRVAIDSLTSFAMLFESEYEKRLNILRFFTMLESWGCTILLTSERTATFDISFEESGLEFLVDGTILLYNIRKGNTREQAIEVLKMRATDIEKRICPITISTSGITVFPQSEVFSAFD